jgi:hypothetical protein
VAVVIKRLYLANGILLAPLSKASEDVAVDGDIADLLDTLGLGDHCYLTLVNECVLEVIKIRKDYSGFRVDRGQDGTCTQGFPTGTRIVYRLTGVEIQDATTAANYNIYASGYGFANVSGGNGNWTIGADAIHADTVGGIEARTEGNELVIFDKIGMFGCCDGGVTGAPFIPGPFFYLTSMLYPQEVIELVTPNPKDRLGNPIPPIYFNSDWWLLVQPSILDKYVSHGVGLLDWENYGSETSFTAPTEKYISQDIGVGVFDDWYKFGGEADFTAPPEKYIARGAYPLEMLMFGGQVDYPRALDKYVLPTIKLLDWTLS